MIREHVFSDRTPADKDFRWRGGDVSRLEALSDGVFALAISLLVLTTSAPTSGEGMLELIRSMPALALCFALVVWIWYQHCLYFRRYGFEGPYVVALNAALLFLVLFYVFPLRYVALLVVGRWTGIEVDTGGGPGPTELLVFYSGGFTGIFVLFYLMVRHAWARREELQLDELERYLTRASGRTHLVSMGIGALSLALAFVELRELAGLVFFLMGPAHGVAGWLHGRRTVELRNRLADGG